jgi:hypothetical protein
MRWRHENDSSWSWSSYAALQRKPRILVRTPWDAHGLMCRAKVDDPSSLLGNLLSVTGDVNLAQAEKCKDYVSRNWPGGGLDVLAVLEQVIHKGSLAEYLEGSGKSGTEPVLQRHKLAGAKDGMFRTAWYYNDASPPLLLHA